MNVKILIGDCRDVLRRLPDASVQCCVTSPPYFGLRDYGVAGQIGLEPTPDAFVAEMVAVFREVRRVLRDDGTVWLNLGDSYSTDGRKGRSHMGTGMNSAYSTWSVRGGPGLKPKDLIGIPWMVAKALKLRSIRGGSLARRIALTSPGFWMEKARSALDRKSTRLNSSH